MSTSTSVIFGTGQIGTRIARRLVARGERVRVISRSARAEPGIEAIAGDARDPAFAIEAARDASVVYDTLNPLYHQWPRDLLALGRGSLAAATAHGAKLVALDNLYLYGAPTGAMTERSPTAPTSKKGALRAELAAIRLEALAKGAPIAIVRASDFFGPALPTSWFGARFFTRVMAGKPAELIGDPDQPHSYTYAEDVAAAMIELGGARDATGVWHVPTAPAISSRELATRVGEVLDRSVAIRRLPRLLVRALGIVSPLMRELPEMAYQWEMPFVIDDAKFRARFGTVPTPLADQIAATVAWARRTYGAATVAHAAA